MGVARYIKDEKDAIRDVVYQSGIRIKPSYSPRDLEAVAPWKGAFTFRARPHGLGKREFTRVIFRSAAHVAFVERETAEGIAVIEYGIDKFNELCKKSVFTYIQDWERLTDRIAFWVDLQDAYVTYTNDYIESVWWILKNFWDKDLLYKGYKVVPYCPRCGTPRRRCLRLGSGPQNLSGSGARGYGGRGPDRLSAPGAAGTLPRKRTRR